MVTSIENKRQLSKSPSERAEEVRRYWDSVGDDWQENKRDCLWRQCSDAIHVWWLERVISDIVGKRILKTDLFDEAFGGGLTEWFAAQGGDVVACDLALSIATVAKNKKTSVTAAVADVLHLPFFTGSFDHVLSDSTLDHFAAEEEIKKSLHEMFRVLRPGGTLLLTMDNPRNPIVWLRNKKPDLWRRLKLVPYKIGVTCTTPRLVQLMTTVGFEIISIGTIMHSPRVLMVLICRWLTLHRGQYYPTSHWLHWLQYIERLNNLPINQLTGHFIAAVGRKPALQSLHKN
jgi:ubiquinone/menaquinone biosynthesis C-methylase UbiE